MTNRLALLTLAFAVLVVSFPAQADDKAHWGYSGAEGFQHWGDLDTEYHACKDGLKQSPIDIRAYNPQNLPPLETSYTAGDMEVINNGHTIQVNLTNGGHMNVGGKKYDVLQFHFHTPSEHYIDGAPYPMEVHFVHKAEDGTLGVVGVLMELGAENTAIGKIWSGIETKTANLSAADLLPANLDYYKYEGSLTTPPCSEGVQWHVVKQAITISEAQLLAFQGLFSVNARPVQPLHDRKVVAD